MEKFWTRKAISIFLANHSLNQKLPEKSHKLEWMLCDIFSGISARQMNCRSQKYLTREIKIAILVGPYPPSIYLAVKACQQRQLSCHHSDTHHRRISFTVSTTKWIKQSLHRIDASDFMCLLLCVLLSCSLVVSHTLVIAQKLPSYNECAPSILPRTKTVKLNESHGDIIQKSNEALSTGWTESHKHTLQWSEV